MKLYRNKVLVGADRWARREDPPKGVEFCSCDIDEETCRFCPGGYVNTPEGKVKIEFGDWVISGVKGEKRVCTNEVFQLTYEAVDGL